MKCLLILLYALTATTPASADIETALPATEVIKINPRVYALLGPAELPDKNNRGYMVNSTAIIGDRGVILIDTGFSHETGEHIRTAVAGITHKPVTHVINTHDHGDHVLGNSAFRHASIISSEKCKSAMAGTAYEWLARLESLTGLQFPQTVPVLPSVTYAEDSRTAITIEGVNLVIWVPPGSHTSNDLMVYLPEDRVLVAGDIVVNDMMPNFRDATIKHWISTLEQISRMPLSVIIPGHGRLMTREGVNRMTLEMQKLHAATEAGYMSNLTDSEIRQTLDLDYWKQLKYFDPLMGVNISRVYLEVEHDSF